MTNWIHPSSSGFAPVSSHYFMIQTPSWKIKFPSPRTLIFLDVRTPCLIPVVYTHICLWPYENLKLVYIATTLVLFSEDPHFCFPPGLNRIGTKPIEKEADRNEVINSYNTTRLSLISELTYQNYSLYGQNTSKKVENKSYFLLFSLKKKRKKNIKLKFSNLCFRVSLYLLLSLLRRCWERRRKKP